MTNRTSARRAAAALAATLVLAASAPAFAELAPQFRPTLHVQRATGPIRIDGELDDAGWQRAARADGFAEVSPGDQIEPPVPSEAWVTYDDRHLYVALIAGDRPGDVRASMCDRDAIFRDDYFGVLIDPYGDQSSAYELFVNPLGIQGDMRLLSNGDEDETFDMLWESRGRITDTGYQVELAIPFTSLRLPDRPEQTWRVNFWRDHQRDVRRQYAWAATDRDNPCDMCQWGTLTGISGISVRRPVEVIASALGSQSGRGDPDTRFDMGDPTGEASASAKYAVSSGSFLEVTVNPDFSQVESDPGQIDVNETFALSYDERRPFFQEGSDLLRTKIDAIYTRSINDPDVAGKFTGQYDRGSVVYLAAQDARSPILIPLEEKSRLVAGGRSFSNILRVRRSLKEDSYVGGLVTDRRLEGGGSGTLVGLDGLARRGVIQLRVQGLLSRTEEPRIADDRLTGTFGSDGHTVALDGERYWGNATYASLERKARTYSAKLDYQDYSPEFRADNGFSKRNGYRQATFWHGLYFRPNHPWLADWEPGVDVGRAWSTGGTLKNEWIHPALYLHTKGQTEIGLEGLAGRQRYAGETFPGIRTASVWVDSRFSELVNVSVTTSFGRSIYYGTPELADQHDWSAQLRLRPSRHVEVNTSFNRARMDSRVTNETFYSGTILRSRADVSLSRRLFVRLVVQYDEFGDRLDVEPLVTYRVNPFTMFFLGATSGYEKFQAADYATLTADDWQRADRQIFAKIQYQFRL